MRCWVLFEWLGGTWVFHSLWDYQQDAMKSRNVEWLKSHDDSVGYTIYVSSDEKWRLQMEDIN